MRKCALMCASFQTYIGRVFRYDLVTLKDSSIFASPEYMEIMSEAVLFSSLVTMR